MKLNKLTLSLLTLTLATFAVARTEFEGFEGPTKATIFENPFFNHSLNPSSITWDPWTADFFSGSQSIILYPDTDIITFNTVGAEEVTSAQIQVLSLYGDAIVRFNGKDSNGTDVFQETTYSQGVANWVLSSSDNRFDYLTSIEITGFEGVFDDLSVEVVPEPATVSLLALGALAALRKRKK